MSRTTGKATRLSSPSMAVVAMVEQARMEAGVLSDMQVVEDAR